MKIVTYHYVRKETNALPFLKFLHFEDFIKQLNFFQEDEGLLRADVLYDALTNRRVPKGYLLSFDDGLKDHYEFVFPELQRRGISAFFFINTGWYRHQKILPVHIIHLLLGKYGGDYILQLLEDYIEPPMISETQQQQYANAVYKTQSNDDATSYVKKLLNYYVSGEYLPGIIAYLAEQTQLDAKTEGEKLYLSKEEIAAMHAAGMIMGSHTENHPVLSKLSYEEQENEIRSSMDYFPTGFQINTPNSFCYPYGGPASYNSDSLKALSRLHFRCAFAVDARDVTSEDLVQHPLQLPRYDCNMFPHGQAWSAASL